jgi:hypothetical protein
VLSSRRMLVTMAALDDLVNAAKKVNNAREAAAEA